jgi:GH43 family beta-xylosidase
MKRTILFLAVIALSAATSFAQNRVNPVIKGIADAGCIRFAGKYYLGGVATYGDFFVSSDLMNWDNRIHVFDLDNEWTHGTGAKNNQIHANDMSYSGGLFHLLFSVNYWGNDKHIVHITHATSPNIEGPYKEVREDQWFENRIDPQIFQDEDGRLYLYMVKFTDGNTIWGRPLDADFHFTGDAVQQFASLPGTWETLDNRVAEGPFVIKYRGRYYMMYNANHTAPEFGNYHLGVCEAPSPLAFGNGGKYSHPVVGPNTEPISETYTDLLRYGSKGYNDINLSDDTIRFTLDRVPDGNIYMLLAQRGGCRISLNGNLINKGDADEYEYIKVDQSRLHTGENIITVEKNADSNRRRNPALSHLYLYAMGSETPDEVLVTPGQPNIVRGPNGWEWWLVYMANQGWRRHQFVDRIHFVNNRLTVDGITGIATAGFHPAPAEPQYSGTSLDSIPKADAYLLEITCRRNGIPEEWRIEHNYGMLTAWKNKELVRNHIMVSANEVDELIKEAKGDEIIYASFCEGYDEYADHFSGWDKATVSDGGLILPDEGIVLKSCKADDYAFTAEVSIGDTEQEGSCGIIAAWIDSKNYISVGVDVKEKNIVTEQVIKGKSNTTVTPLTYTEVHYPDIKYSDGFEKQYRFTCPTYVDAVGYPHLDASHDGYADALSIRRNSKRLYRNDMAGMMTLEYLDGETDKWMPIDYKETTSDNAAWQTVTFPAVKTTALRMINKDPRQNDRNIYKIKTRRLFEQDNQIRVEKRGSKLYVFCGQRHVQTLDLGKTATTKAGLFNRGLNDVKIKNTLYYKIK